jgi:hypothetical protein
MQATLPNVGVGMVIDGAVTPKATVAALAKARPAADVLTFRAGSATTTGQWAQPSITPLTQAFAGVLPPLLLDAPSASDVDAAACLQGVAGVALDPTTTDAAVTSAVAAAAHGTVICPGLATVPTIGTSEFPTTVTSGTPVALRLACVRDCLYVAVLVGSDGRPVVAKRGALKGGDAPSLVVLPKTQLGQASYALDVRVVSRVNPGAALELASPPLPRSG